MNSLMTPGASKMPDFVGGQVPVRGGRHFYAEHVPAQIIRLNLGFSLRTADRSLKHLQGNSGPI